MGHSYGGLLALMLAQHRAPHVRSLTLYDPVAFGVLVAAADAEGLADLDRAASNPVFLDDAVEGARAIGIMPSLITGMASARRRPCHPHLDAFLRVGRKVFYEVRSLMADTAEPTPTGNCGSSPADACAGSSPRHVGLWSCWRGPSLMQRFGVWTVRGTWARSRARDLVNDIIVEHLAGANVISPTTGD